MKSVFPYIFGATIFLISIVLTDAIFWADSADYVDSVIAFQQNVNYNFWEFGHLFWRPLGWFVWFQFFPYGEADSWRKEIITTFLWFNYIAGFCSTLLFVGILKKLKLPFWVIGVATLGLVFSHAFLNFSQTGTSYITALMFYLFGLFFSFQEKAKTNFFYPILSGAFLALALCFWMPYLWVVPAAMVVPLILCGFGRQGVIVVSISAISCLLTILFSYWIVLTILQINTLGELKSWIAASSHGNETRGVMRVIFGLARSFVHMGNDGPLFKRFLLSDPYNPVSFASLISGSLWKLILFYSLTAGVLFSLWQSARGRQILILLLAAALPLLGFAIFFDGGAVERYLPLFPFAFIGIAVALDIENWKFLRYGILTILLTFVIVNTSTFSAWAIAETQRRTAFRIEPLVTRAQAGDKIFLVNWTDDLINFNRSFPFHPINLKEDLKLNAVVTPGTDQTKQWREEFAVGSLSAWEKGQNVWLSARAFSNHPKAEWNWVEGDDKNVKWEEFPEFFGNLEVGETLGDENGFVLILPSEANKRYLQVFKDRFMNKIQNFD